MARGTGRASAERLKKKRAARLTKQQAIDRIEGMLPLIEKEIFIAIEMYCALEAANKVVMDEMKGVHFYGGNCYNAVSRTLAVSLALQVAKLLDLPRPRHGETAARRHNSSDVVSLPLLVRLLSQSQCRRHYRNQAAGWYSSSVYSRQGAEECERAIDETRRLLKALSVDLDGRRALRRTRQFRNYFAAHTLMDQAQRYQPTYDQIFLLYRCARDCFQHVRLAVSGIGSDMVDHEEANFGEAMAFWTAALAAAAKQEDLGWND